MKLSDARESYYTYSGKLSDIARQLNFAGIGVIWIFRVGGEHSGGIIYSAPLLYPLGCFVLSLGFDSLQYLYASIAWSAFHRYKEKRVDNEAEFKAPAGINYPTILFFYSKVLVVLVGYGYLVTTIARQLVGT